MSRNVQSLERGLAVLEALVKNGATGVTDLSNQLDLDKTVVHRLLTTLQGMGYVAQDENRKYQIGPRTKMMSARVLTGLDLRTTALPYMQVLAERLKGVAHLATMAESRAVYIERVVHPEFNVPSTGVGGESPGNSSAAGKVLWAFLPQRELHDLLDQIQFKAHTANTITDRNTLMEHLAQVYAQGYAVDREEHRLGLVGVGAPVRDYAGNVIASICVAGWSRGMTDELIASTRELVIDAARLLSTDMGYPNGQF